MKRKIFACTANTQADGWEGSDNTTARKPNIMIMKLLKKYTQIDFLPAAVSSERFKLEKNSWL